MRYFFQWMILITMTLSLAACGGSSGSKGDTGATGATGADGTDGTIAVPSDSDLMVHFNGAAGANPGGTPTAVPLDSGRKLGALGGQLIIEGTDNLTEDNRTRYYVYTETSAGVKSAMKHKAHYLRDSGMNEWFDTEGDGILDTRSKTADNITIDLDEYPLREGVSSYNTGSYTTAFISVCPGNEAGDGACAKVKAPAYDRGKGKESPQEDGLGAVAASITYAGSSFHLVADNGTLANAKVMGFRLSSSKSGYESEIPSDNTSTALHPGGDDNDTRVSNIITRGSNVWVAVASDNSTTGAEGDNVSLIVRTDGTADFTDNGTHFTNQTALTTAPQIAGDDDSIYIMLGAGTTVTPNIAYDNGTNLALGTATVGTADTWCSTAPSTGGYAVIVADNGSTGGAAGIEVFKALDNTTTTELTLDNAHAFNDLETGCALTMIGSRAYLALLDSGSPDNLSVWYSDNLTTWTQIGSDVATTRSSTSGIAIGTIGTTSSGAGGTGDVWVAVNENGQVYLYHYEDISGGSSPAWRRVGDVLRDAVVVSLATDNSSVIAVSGTSDNYLEPAAVGWWFNQ